MDHSAFDIELFQRVEGRLAALRTDRYSFWIHWAELARYILPRRYRWLVTPNQMNRGQEINQAIIDSTGTIAARVLAAGMMSGMTSPTRQWFNLRIEGTGSDESDPINVWLGECKKRMMRVFQESNFYNGIAVVFQDLAVFGTAPMLVYEDFENVIQCYNPCAGEYYLANSPRLVIDVFYREMVMTSAQAVAEFGKDNVSKSILDTFNQGQGAGLQQEFVIGHAIEPNSPKSGIPAKFAFLEVYWERGSVEQGKFLRKKGYNELPGIFPRWDITGNDAYGRSPGMDALGDIKQLQMETKRKAQVIDKMANPPMLADVELKNQPASSLPGGVTYIAKKDGIGFKPAYENFRPPVRELMEDIQEVQLRIKNIFFNDLFLMFQQLQAEPRSATAIDARREEKMVMLGPVLERFQTEALDPVIDRVFGIMQRGGLLPEAPEEIQGKPIQVEYISMLAAAQKAVETAGIERFFQIVGNTAAIAPETLDLPDWDYSINLYSSLLGNDPRLIVSQEIVKQRRDAKAKQAQQQYLVEMGQGAAKAGKTLSDTQVGGGTNALEAMLGGQQ